MELTFERPESWTRITRVGGGAVLGCYLLFLLYAYRDTSGFLILDYVNLMIHEAGHLFFGWGGRTLMLLGGSIGELLVPVLCGAFFFYHRQTYGLAFSLFWFFENFLYIGTYMADARACALPLVNSDIGDWTILFGQWGLLTYDVRIGRFMRQLGWLGMLGIVVWLGYRLYADAHPQGELRPLQM
jgi:hypothetical protein